MAALGMKCLRKYPGLSRQLQFSFSSESTATSAVTNEANYYYQRTTESNPAKHTQEQSGLYYTVPPNEAAIFQYGGFTKKFVEQCRTFNETNIMLRRPAIEIIQRLKDADLSLPPSKFVLYGNPGVGKSLILAHVLHYASKSKFILLHVPWVGNWLRSPKRFEVVNSLTHPGCVDLPESAVIWLQHFKNQNASLIQELNLELANDYEWSKREVSKAGDSLMSIVELGLSRSRHACQVINAIVREIKGSCIANRCKTLVAIDGFNAFFHKETRVKNEERQIMPPEKVSFIPALMSTTAADWHNAAAVVTCDELVVPGHNASPLPLYQLGVEGFHNLDPFIPVHVPEMTEAEIRNILAYYKERRWLRDSQGDDELVFLCGGNPYKLMNVCNPL